MTQKIWDGKISNLKISPQSFPELYDELSKMQHKERSDRLRCLALIGFYSLVNCGRIGGLPSANSFFGEGDQMSGGDTALENNNAVIQKRTNLKHSLLRSL